MHLLYNISLCIIKQEYVHKETQSGLGFFINYLILLFFWHKNILMHQCQQPNNPVNNVIKEINETSHRWPVNNHVSMATEQLNPHNQSQLKYDYHYPNRLIMDLSWGLSPVHVAVVRPTSILSVGSMYSPDKQTKHYLLVFTGLGHKKWLTQICLNKYTTDYQPLIIIFKTSQED